MKKFLTVLLCALLVIGCFAACGKQGGDDTPAPSANELTIGVFEPTTGENGGGGMQEVLGIRYANSLKNKVTINGTEYTIKLAEVDNQSDKTAAVTAAQQLISQNVVAVVGSYGSGVSIAAGETFANAKVPAVGASCTNPQVTLGNDYYFRVCFLDPFQGTVMANYAFDSGYTKAAVISQNGDDYSTGLANYFKDAFVKLGGEIVSDQVYQTNDTDFRAILTTIMAAEPQVIFAPSSMVTASLLLPQAAELGNKAVIMAGDTWENTSIISEAAEGVVFSTFFDEKDTANTIAADFVTGFKAYLNGDPANLAANNGNDGVAAVSALGYDAYMSVYTALAALDGKEGEITGEAVQAALKGISYDGVTGTVTFNENGDANKNVAYIKTVKDGAFSFVKTQKAE